jgi:MFS family permease
MPISKEGIRNLEPCTDTGNGAADAAPSAIDSGPRGFFGDNTECCGDAIGSAHPNTKLNIDKQNTEGQESCEHLNHSVSSDGSSRKGIKFWLIFAALCMTSLLGGLDTTVTATALATMSSEIGGQGQYVWFANVGTVTMTAVQPFFGQLANIFGRRYMTLFAVGIFILGSAVSGAAISPGMLIGGRAVQGIGTGALMMLQDLIVCDLVPLRERGKYISIFTASAGVAASLGPLIGGAIAEWNWRWIFYLNLPIGGLALIAVALLLHTKHRRSPTWLHALMRIDYVGNAIFMTAVVALLLGIVMGGQNVFPWSSWRVLLPLLIGVLGLVCFVFYERSAACKEPIIPLQLFANRTSAIAFILTFCSGMLL